MSLRELPAPQLEHLKNQARSLLREHLGLNVAAAQRFAAFGITSAKPKLADALHVIAPELGFDTWPMLKLHIEAASEEPVEALTAAVKANSASLVRDILTRHPSLRPRINEPLPNYGFDAPALIAAVNHENREMIDLLVDEGRTTSARAGGPAVTVF